jgi:proteasome accessory factor A
MDKRIIGIETEFGCLVSDDSVGTAEMVVEQVKDMLSTKTKWV